MNRRMALWMAGVLLVAPGAIWAQAGGKSVVAPKLQSAGNIPYPINSSSPGMVALQLSLGASGSVNNVQVVHDAPPFTGPAQSAVQGWSFAAAKVNGNAAASSLLVNVVFNPFNPGGVALPNDAMSVGVADASGSGFTPPQVTSGSYATYPVNSVASGTVVLDVTVGKAGGIKRVRVVQGTAPLSSAATQAVRGWSFSGATYKGQGIDSHVVVAFVFPSPAAGTQ